MPQTQPPPAFPVYILRHGQTDWNSERRIQGQSESDLTALGQAQAEAQGRILRWLFADGWPPVHASPLRRTRQTAQRAIPEDVPVRFDDRLKEIALGAWEGHLWSDIVRRDPALGAPGLPVLARCFMAPGGESEAALRGRAEAFVATLAGPAVLVTHGVVGAVIRGLLCGLSRAEVEALDHLQGVVYRIEAGVETVLAAD